MMTTTRARTLDGIAAQAPDLRGVWKRDLQTGDWVIVRTRNSVYTLAVLGDGKFGVCGGWFQTAANAPSRVGVLGCTWGGRAILTGMVAAPGMFLEFDNDVRTTQIREVQVIRGNLSDSIN